MQIDKDNLVEINGKKAIVVKLLDTSQMLVPKCEIRQDGKIYTVALEDLKPYKGVNNGNS